MAVAVGPCEFYSGCTELSSVLLAMGGSSPDLALGAVRFSLERWTMGEQMDRAVSLLAEQVSALISALRGRR